jgi:putative RNA 2'-phosphotransferase
MAEIDLIKLSRVVSHALRHEPEAYGLKLDNEGWVSLVDLVAALRVQGFSKLQNADVVLMIEKSEKKRHQIEDGRIRAYYGHSTAEKIIRQHQQPPAFLYHGTSENNVPDILEKGLLPMERQHVHLSINKELALIVANRKQGRSVILSIQAAHAYKDGVLFYKEENGVWLSDAIPSGYISIDV